MAPGSRSRQRRSPLGSFATRASLRSRTRRNLVDLGLLQFEHAGDLFRPRARRLQGRQDGAGSARARSEGRLGTSQDQSDCRERPRHGTPADWRAFATRATPRRSSTRYRTAARCASPGRSPKPGLLVPALAGRRARSRSSRCSFGSPQWEEGDREARGSNLAVFVLKDVGVGALEDAGGAPVKPW